MQMATMVSCIFVVAMGLCLFFLRMVVMSRPRLSEEIAGIAVVGKVLGD